MEDFDSCRTICNSVPSSWVSSTTGVKDADAALELFLCSQVVIAKKDEEKSPQSVLLFSFTAADFPQS
ncbi:hypothetical protein vseg_013885 [Gypsophila vaccaria]